MTDMWYKQQHPISLKAANFVRHVVQTATMYLPLRQQRWYRPQTGLPRAEPCDASGCPCGRTTCRMLSSRDFCLGALGAGSPTCGGDFCAASGAASAERHDRTHRTQMAFLLSGWGCGIPGVAVSRRRSRIRHTCSISLLRGSSSAIWNGTCTHRKHALKLRIPAVFVVPQ